MTPNVIGGNPAVRRVVKGSRSAGDEASEEQVATHLDTVQHIRQTAGTKRSAEDDVMVSPVKRAHTIPFPLTQTLLLSAAGRKAMLVPRDAMKCEGVGLVNGGHTLFGRSAQVLYELQGEEVEGVRQEVREVKDEENGEINVEGEPHTS